VPANPSPLSLEAAANALNKFGFDCAFYRRTKRDLLANGWSEVQIFGRSEIDVDTLLLGFLDPQDAQPVSTWCSRTVNKLLPASPLPVRLASTWLLTKLMRVSPSFPWRRVVANASKVSHLAKCREYECQSGMVDATSREAGDISI
jgi:hypothetical protein